MWDRGAELSHPKWWGSEMVGIWRELTIGLLCQFSPKKSKKAP
jgi:hypothetical protein